MIKSRMDHYIEQLRRDINNGVTFPLLQSPPHPNEVHVRQITGRVYRDKSPEELIRLRCVNEQYGVLPTTPTTNATKN